ncbi:uncharacterized protein Z519_09412 [Cladophialophora bantiana CBS 173.52]|uniref:Heterokaryon incompatibility domain-containing protein n=1 Tax=Cladophialophora bantiana (strain ATCC 10958 / CBS 173.52 / CDC B-1940 / NIH 8579) TaxID=1442370 RepID=A0A0D2FTW7_CLAB1|nr:uncharacterized protein Z519_09412 [Cladophialophora bantiana CBS 173.52]KIW89982.1 hypothetical protein Z519_09412 [Cladophialophora bantiana CBS 173.52]
MDHLPLPSNPVIGSLPVPFLCKEPYDGDSFLTYPFRKGWNVTAERWPETLSRHGKEVRDEAQIASFLQKWLYFGLLCEVTGNTIDPMAFRVPGRTRNTSRFSSKSLTDIVGQWSLESMTLECELDESLQNKLGDDIDLCDQFDDWVSKRDDIIDAAEATWNRVIDAYQDKMTDTLSLVLLSIAALGDYLSQALADIARARGIGDGTPSTLWLLPQSVCQPLLRRLQNWCPNRLHGFVNVQGFSIGVLWYIANLDPPKVRDDHGTCSPQRCNSLHIDVDDYDIQHIKADCECELISPSTKEMVRIVHRNSIALFTVQHAAGEAMLSIQDEKRTRNYVAISHVWADGHGNLQANSLPTCVLEKLQHNVDALGISNSRVVHTPIWMDTICLPRFPLDLRRKALLHLSDIFVKAGGVLVLDSYLQASDSLSISPIEILARISISGWTTRLWTFSEGRLARRVWFQFRGRAVDLYDLMNNWHEELKLRIPASPLTNVSYGMAVLHSATNLLESGQDRERPLELGQIKIAMNSRQTSWPSDEALCLGAILQLDLSTIIDAEDSKKMAAFWRQVDSVPIGIIFTRCSPKLEDAGCRWAPATLLGGTNSGFAKLAFQNSIEIAMYYVPRTDTGLEYTVDAALPVTALLPVSRNKDERTLGSKHNFINLCRQPTASAAGKAIMLKDNDGSWYSCLIQDLWHQTPVVPDCRHEMPVFFVQDHTDLTNMRQQNDVEVWNRYPAVFATYRPSKKPFHARAHTHVSLTRLPEVNGQALDTICGYSLAFKKKCRRGSLILPDNEDKMLNIVAAWMQATHAEAELNSLATSILPYEPLDSVVESAVALCARYICYFSLVGEWYKVTASDPFAALRWCID